MNYTETDQKLHGISQLIAKVNRTYVPQEEDDSHTNLQFDSLGWRLAGRWISTPSGRVMCTLNLRNLQIEWLNDAQEVVHKTTIIGKTMVEIEQDQIPILSGLKLNAKGYHKKLHFTIPVYGFIQEPMKAIPQAAIEEWVEHRKLANEWCNQVLVYTKSTSEVRIWPHHFDTGIYTNPNENIGLGFGLAMQDEMVKQPYFYLAGYPTNHQIRYDSAPNLAAGRWETGAYWKGAVLPLDQLAGLTRREQDATFQQFVQPAIDWFLNA